MAEILRYVDPNANAGGDGTTNALTGASCAYVSLNAWEAATQQDLTDAGGDTARVVCSSDDAGVTHAADTTVCSISGWTTSATCYIIVEAASSHGGKWNDTIYRMDLGTNPATSSLIISEPDVYVVGIQIQFTIAGLSTGATRTCLYFSDSGATGSGYIDKCIIRGDISIINTTTCYGIMTENGSYTKYVRNSLVYGFINGSEPHVGFRNRSTNLEWHNCTAYNCNRGFERSIGTVAAKNCGAAACTTGFVGTITQTTCSTTTPTFVDEAGDDFHLASGDTTWKDQGTDLSATFTDDIDGVTRTGTWDIGADEYVSLSIQGSTCWGHSTGVTQDNTRTFGTNWTGTGQVEYSGDNERLAIHVGEYMESEVVQVTPYYVVTLSQNQYGAGDLATIKYKTGATIEACQAAEWSTYSATFQSLGYVQVRVEN